MDFREYFLDELRTVAAQEGFAKRANTSRAYLTHIARGRKSVELGFADVLVALAAPHVSLDGIPLTANARRQRRIREQVAVTTPPARATA